MNPSKYLINAIIAYIHDAIDRQMMAKRHRESTIKPMGRRDPFNPNLKASRVSPLIAPSASANFNESVFIGGQLHSHPSIIQPSPSVQLNQFGSIVVSPSATQQSIPPLASNSSMPVSPLSPLAELSPSEREEKIRAELLRKNLSIVSKMHLLLFICGYSESKKNDRSIKSMRITQSAEVTALLEDEKESISKRVPEIYKFKNLVKSVIVAYRIY